MVTIWHMEHVRGAISGSIKCNGSEDPAQVIALADEYLRSWCIGRHVDNSHKIPVFTAVPVRKDGQCFLGGFSSFLRKHGVEVHLRRQCGH